MKYTKLLSTLSFAGVALFGLTATAAPVAKEGSEPRYTSRYHHADRQIDRLNVDQFTSAPLQIVVMARLNVAPEKAFDLVSRRLPEWVSQIPKVDWNHQLSANVGAYGQGSVRTCAFGQREIIENIRYWDEGHAYAYNVDDARSTASFPIKNHLGVFIVESDGQSGSLITWRQYFNRKFSLMAPMAPWGMRIQVMQPGLRKLIEQHGGELVKATL